MFIATETVETVETFHMTFGEWMVSVTAIILAIATVALIIVSAKLVKVTAMAANAEMAKVATNANDDMANVSIAAITHSAPVGHLSHRPVVRKVTRHHV